MAEDLEGRTISLRACRRAAREVRRAEHGTDAIGTVRPRGVLGVTRSRLPLALILYRAALEGRLAWRDEHTFALLEPPLAMPAPVGPGGLRAGALRLLDRRWELLLMAVPPLLAMLLGALLALVRPELALWSILLVAAATGYVALLMTTSVLFMAFTLVRDLSGGSARPERTAAASLPGTHWSIPLCHVADAHRTEEILDLAAARLADLVSARVAAFAVLQGAWVRRLDVTEVVVCLRAGVTTAAARDAVAGAAGVETPYGPDGQVVLLMPFDRPDADPPRFADAGGFLFLYLGALAGIVLLGAFLVADRESAACLPELCAGHPATYREAVRWLAQRLLGSDPPGLTPLTGPVWVYGWLTSIAGFTTVPVLAAAVSRYAAVRRAQLGRLTTDLRRRTMTTLLVLTVNEVERDAMIASVRARTGARPKLMNRGDHPVLDLGHVSGARILLAQCTQQGVGGPGGVLSVTQGLLDLWRPDFVIMAGVCFGLRDDAGQQIGDIIVSARVQDLDHRKVFEDLDGNPSSWIRGVHVPPSTALLARFNLARPLGWLGADIHTGLLLSQSVLVNSPTYRATLKEAFPDALGGDMESAGLYAAAEKCRTDWIVVKGIADWGMGKHSADQPVAARNAADLVVHIVTTGSLNEPMGGRNERQQVR